MINVLLHGCNGKMGKMISNTAENFSDLKIAAGIDKNANKNFDYPVFEKICDCNINCDVILDFSRPDSLDSLLEYAKKNNLPLILCTTGYTDEQLNKIEKASAEIPLFRSANMSIGINILNNVLKQISAFLYEDFDIEIIEKHHNQKVDAPSGTALLLGNTIKSSLPSETKFTFGREGTCKRTKDEIGIHAIRGGTIVGEHDVIFAGKDEIIQLNHTALSREVFAVGALKACQFMNGKKTGMYSMDDVIKR
ncbi:4-hydroxy-tetrahydrodipicolinate reductase [Haloimpatiens sp. FM7330]|uniref:4-hydroxy-tetrahydrodipicolinate reductase n=1 Tax=Haloimpatiens sp. FM7330 TaxID=3298610 RepID=UPI003633B99C